MDELWEAVGSIVMYGVAFCAGLALLTVVNEWGLTFGKVGAFFLIGAAVRAAVVMSGEDD